MIESLLAYGWWVAVLFVVIGFVALVKGADWLVDGASSIAKRFGISDLIIGLTVVAFGTSMPEFVVNMVSVGHGTTDLAITNILGSNIINTFVILGVTALVYPIVSQKHSRNFDIPLSIVAGFIVLTLVIFSAPFEQFKGISRIGGVILLAFFAFFLYDAFVHAKSTMPTDEQPSTQEMTLGKAIALILFGLIGLSVGGELIVDGAVDLAARMGVSEAVVGLTVVALGTSLPELATSVIAAYKKNTAIAIGNVFGSNVFNVFFVLGTSAVVRPLPAYQGIEFDAFMAALGSIVVWLVLRTNKERILKRWGGALLLLIYAGYLAYRLLNV